MSNPDFIKSIETRLDALVERWQVVVNTIPGNVEKDATLAAFRRLLTEDVRQASHLMKEARDAYAESQKLRSQAKQELHSAQAYRERCQRELDTAEVSCQTIPQEIRDLALKQEVVLGKSLGTLETVTQLKASIRTMGNSMPKLDTMSTAIKDMSTKMDAFPRSCPNSNESGFIGAQQVLDRIDDVKGRVTKLTSVVDDVVLPAVDQNKAQLMKLDNVHHLQGVTEDVKLVLDAVKSIGIDVQDLNNSKQDEQHGQELQALLSSTQCIEKQLGKLDKVEQHTEEMRTILSSAQSIEKQLGKLNNIEQHGEDLKAILGSAQSIQQQIGKLDGIELLPNLVHQVNSTCNDSPRTAAVTRIDEKVNQHGISLQKTMDSIHGIKGQLENMATLNDIQDSLNQAGASSGQPIPASQDQVDAVDKKVDGLSTGLTNLSDLLQSLLQTSIDDPPRKKARLKSASPRKARVGLSPMKRSTGNQRVFAVVHRSNVKESTPTRDPHLPKGVDAQRMSQLNMRLGPMISILGRLVPCSDKGTWKPDAVINRVLQVFATDALAATNLEQGLDTGIVPNTWHCTKQVCDRSYEDASLLDEDEMCDSPWCATKKSCLQLYVDQTGDRYIQMRLIDIN